MMEFALARENQETSELVGAAELRADMTRGVALQRGDTVKKSLFRLKDRHYAQILDYLETNDHFAEIMGSGKKMKVGGKNQSKASAFGHMAVELRQLGWHVLTGAAVKKKTERYVENYRKALVFYKGTGSGVTEEERQAGVTMEAKMNALCPHFSRMHALFGSRPNVDPPALCMICIPADERNLVWDSQVDIGVDRMVDRIVDGSNFDDEIHEVEDAVPDEENQDDVSESVVEEIPSIGGNEASPIMNRHESAEASPSELIQMWIGTREVQCWSCSKMLKSKRQNSNLLCWLRKRNTGLGCWRSEKQYERRNRGLERRRSCGTGAVGESECLAELETQIVSCNFRIVRKHETYVTRN
ncbi:hypothetical protein R1sor_004150 [Riccia sorocarpa]|uniref:Uncharacterized protein n=1 Tax=Riccia sorocarpa TaxID=122646 RepID=A0ABD3H3Z4_9MARC